MPESNSNGGGFSSWSGGLFDAIGDLATAGFGFGSAYVGSQTAQQIAATNAAAGSQAVKPVYAPNGQVQFVPVQQTQQNNNNRTWYIVGGVVVFVAVATAIYFGLRSSKG